MIARLAFALLLTLAAGMACAQAQRIDVFYLSAPDCRYCAHWESQSREAFLDSPEGRAVNFVEIRGETLRRPIDAQHYPPEYRWVFEQIGPSRGVPRFLIAVNRKIVMSAFGTGGYQTKVLPALKAVLANQPLENRAPERTRT